MYKRNYFPTLNDALDAEGLTALWPCGSNIQYGQTVRHVVETGETYGKRNEPCLHVISVYRDERGMYERPVHYSTR